MEWNKINVKMASQDLPDVWFECFVCFKIQCVENAVKLPEYES